MPRTARWKGVLVLNWWQRVGAAARGIGCVIFVAALSAAALGAPCFAPGQGAS